MTTGLIYDDRYLDHTTGVAHPERPDRLRAVRVGLTQAGLNGDLKLLTPRMAEAEQLGWLHDAKYVQRVFELTEEGQPYIDTVDCPICRESFVVAQLAAGGVLAACDAVVSGEVRNAFCAVRPPGHHAEFDKAMGFCLFNNVALAAEYLRRQHGLERVAIVDFDVHHCNGTQHTFESRNDVLVISIHEHPGYLYPGTGYPHEKGTGKGEDYTMNVAMMPGAQNDAYEAAMTDRVLPKLRWFRPQILLVSAGFDAAADDPLAHIELTRSYFTTITHRLIDAAEELCDGRLISVLEGGYNLDSLAHCAARHVCALAGKSDPGD